MSIRETLAQRSSRRSRRLRDLLASDFETARRASGLSLRELGRVTGVPREVARRVERADPEVMTIDVLCRLAAAVGLELAASFYSAGEPVRDKGHLALLGRFRARLGPALRWRTEVPIPMAGDRRSADAVVDGTDVDAMVEAITHLHDIQRHEREASAKQPDVGAKRLILLVADTRHNRAVIRLVPELERRFPVATRACLRALADGRDPGGDALVVL